MKDDKIAKIYDAVLDLVLNEPNPLKITVSKIAQKSNIGKGTVYEYFDSKEEIFIRTFEYFINSVVEDTEKIESDNFDDFFKQYFKLIEKMRTKGNALYLTVMFGDSRFDVNDSNANSLKDIFQPLLDAMVICTSTLIGLGVAEGKISMEIEQYQIYYAILGLISSIFATDTIFSDLIFCNPEMINPENYMKCFLKLLN